MKLTPFVFLALLCGCTTMRLEPLSLLQGQTDAVAYRGPYRERKDGKNVSVAGLPEILARATWVDSGVAHKGGIWLRFTEGREIFIPYGFGFFLSRSIRGHFRIREEDALRYTEIVQRIQKEANQSLQPTAPSGRG